MLQYAAPNAPPTFHRSSIFADPSNNSSRRHSAADDSERNHQHHHRHTISASNDAEQENALPGLTALAKAATMNPADDSTTSSTPNAPSAPMASQYAAVNGGNAQPPTCANCQTSTTPLWRRDESGSVLCNACGLFLKLHGRPRPISLKTDVIKSRNRVKASHTNKKRDSQGGPDGMLQAPNGYPAAHPDAAHINVHSHHTQHGLPAAYAGDQPQRLSSPGPTSRSNTPGMPNPNHAPQHMFDSVTLPSDTFASPSLPAFSIRNPSPAPSPLNGSSSHGMEPPQGYEALSQQNQALRTRVSELEVINDLFKGRVTELETNEQQALRKVAELEKRIAELEADGPPAHKKARLGEDDKEHGDNAIDNAAAAEQ